MGSYMYGCKSPNMGYNYGCLIYEPHLGLPMNLQVTMFLNVSPEQPTHWFRILGCQDEPLVSCKWHSKPFKP